MLLEESTVPCLDSRRPHVTLVALRAISADQPDPLSLIIYAEGNACHDDTYWIPEHYRDRYPPAHNLPLLPSPEDRFRPPPRRRRDPFPSPHTRMSHV